MRKFLSAVSVVLTTACRTEASIPASPSGVFPSFNVSSLRNETVQFPAALAGRCNVLVVSFDDAQQPAARNWTGALRTAVASRSGSASAPLQVWDVPIIGNQPRVVQGIIRNAMRKERPDSGARRSTVPLFADTKALEQSLRIDARTAVWIGVVNGDARLIGAVYGARSDSSSRLLDQYLAVCSGVSAEPPRDAQAARTVGPSAAASAVADTEPTPLRTISPADVAALIGKPAVFIYDCNGPELYAQGHVPTSTLMPYDSVTVNRLPPNRDATLVFYCYNELCRASPVAARAAMALGYRNVLQMPAGIAGWKASKLRVER